MRSVFTLGFALLLGANCTAQTTDSVESKHLSNIRQLTFGGDNAEAYFSFDHKQLVFQSNYKEWGVSCDQIFYMDVDKGAAQKPPMLSTGKGRTTCAYFMPGNKQFYMPVLIRVVIIVLMQVICIRVANTCGRFLILMIFMLLI